MTIQELAIYGAAAVIFMIALCSAQFSRRLAKAERFGKHPDTIMVSRRDAQKDLDLIRRAMMSTAIFLVLIALIF